MQGNYAKLFTAVDMTDLVLDNKTTECSRYCANLFLKCTSVYEGDICFHAAMTMHL